MKKTLLLLILSVSICLGQTSKLTDKKPRVLGGTSKWYTTTTLDSSYKRYYFANSGNDANDGHSSTYPKQTIAALNGLTLTAGDTVLFKAGDTFAGQVSVAQSGTVDWVYDSTSTDQVTLVDSASTYNDVGASGTLAKAITLSSVNSGMLTASVLVYGARHCDSVSIGGGGSGAWYKFTFVDSCVYTGGKSVWFYRLLAPPTGAKTVTAYMSSTWEDYSMFLANFSGVNQATPFGTITKQQSLTGPVTPAITLATGDLGWSVIGIRYSGEALTANAPNTLVAKVDYSGILGIAKATGSGSVTLGWTCDGGDNELHALAISIKVAGR